MVFRNIILNPNQSVDGFFNLFFTNLGGFEQVVFDHNTKLNIEFEITYGSDFGDLNYGVSISKTAGVFKLKGKEFDFSLGVSFPYPTNLQYKRQIKINDVLLDINWNGLTTTITQAVPLESTEELRRNFLKSLNASAEFLRAVDIVPLRRGFSHPTYSSVPMSPYVLTRGRGSKYPCYKPFY